MQNIKLLETLNDDILIDIFVKMEEDDIKNTMIASKKLNQFFKRNQNKIYVQKINKLYKCDLYKKLSTRVLYYILSKRINLENPIDKYYICRHDVTVDMIDTNTKDCNENIKLLLKNVPKNDNVKYIYHISEYIIRCLLNNKNNRMEKLVETIQKQIDNNINKLYERMNDKNAEPSKRENDKKYYKKFMKLKNEKIPLLIELYKEEPEYTYETGPDF